MKKNINNGKSIELKTKKFGIKGNAAVIIAAAVAVFWLLLEILLYCTSIPTHDELDPSDFCMSEGTDGTFEIKGKALSISYSEDCGAIENISFSAQVINPLAELYEPVIVRIKAYDPAKSNTLVTYRTERAAIGAQDAIDTVINVDIPEDAGRVVIEFAYDDYDYSISGIRFNVKEGAGFNYLRTFFVLAVILIVFICVRFGLGKKFFDPEKHTVPAMLLCLICILISLLFVNVMNPVQEPVAYPFEKNVTAYNPYEQQFDAIMKGQLHLDIEPSDKLLELENPYDPANRVGVSYSWDRAFYNGKYYSYFGIAPIITVYMPYYLMTETLPAENTVTAIFTIMTALFFSLMAVKWASMYTKKLPLTLLYAGTVGGLIATQVFLIMRGRAKFYYTATIAGMAFLCLFIWLVLCAISGTVRLHKAEENKRRYIKIILYALAGLAYGLLFLSRLNMALLAAFVILPMLYFRILTEKKDGEKRRFRALSRSLPELSALAIPVICAFALQFSLNYMRFGSMLEFGTTYQLTVSDVSLNRIRLTDLPFAFFHYFLHPTSINSDAPMVSLFFINLNNYGHYTYIDTGMGLFSIPFMWMLLGSVLVFRRKREDAGNKAMLAFLLVGMMCVALMNFCLGGVIFRYTCDLTVLGAFASMAILFSLNEDREGSLATAAVHVSSRTQLAAIAFIAVSSIVSISLAFSLNGNLTLYAPEVYRVFRSLFTFY